ncbi:MAG: ABC transporter substrate-binding protein, partial [Muribaculaceae bacterium]|nr:ABC transporter substrate-binding protein [Muribaculaceae bacterium]
MKHLKTTATLAAALLLSACSAGHDRGDTPAEDLFPDMTTRATLLEMRDLGNGATLVDITNPWDTASLLASYLLTDGAARPDSVPPRGRIVEIRVPLERSAVFSAIHAGAIDELGTTGRVAAVADAEYFKGEFARKIADGSIADLGSSLSPSMEKVTLARPDAFILYPMQNAGHGAIDNSGIPVIEMADYMETTPLGRAEWIRLIGRLYGCPAEADSLFAAVECRYDSLAAKASKLEKRPKVLTEMLTSGYWFVPGGNSYMARLITDAGGDYPWAADRSTGSLQLDFSAVYARAADADIWLIRTYGSDLTLAGLREVYPLNSQI